eukprot:9830586-Heterocapsa_arctica.AAC.1
MEISLMRTSFRHGATTCAALTNCWVMRMTTPCSFSSSRAYGPNMKDMFGAIKMVENIHTTMSTMTAS